MIFCERNCEPRMYPNTLVFKFKGHRYTVTNMKGSQNIFLLSLPKESTVKRPLNNQMTGKKS